MKEYYIGTSGWSYPSFRGVLYPEGLKTKDWLRFYAEHFNTVEINATFYRTPGQSTLERWYQETPKNFVFAVKSPKVITHLRRLKDVDDLLESFFKSLAPLQEKVKVILFQLPPSLTFDEDSMRSFLSKLPTAFRYTIEVRNKTFHTQKFYELLRTKGVCLCFSDFGGKYPSWAEVKTSEFLYIRLHGSSKAYFSNYTDKELLRLAKIIKKFTSQENTCHTVYVYFDNTALGYAIPNARRLREILNRDDEAI